MFRLILLLLPLFSTGTLLESQVCAAISPCFIGTIVDAVPDLSYDIFGERGVTMVKKDFSAWYPVAADTIIEFDGIPANAYECQLEVLFLKGYISIHGYEEFSTKFDIWNVDKSVDMDSAGKRTLTWNKAPKAKDLFGTIVDLELPKKVQTETTFNAYKEDVIRVVDSKKCESKMTFRVSVPREIAQGGVEFRQEGDPFGGWVLKYNC